MSGGALIFGIVLIAMLAILIYTLYTRTGSGISPRPSDGSQGAPGAKGQEELSGKDEGDGSTLRTHGTE